MTDASLPRFKELDLKKRQAIHEQLERRGILESRIAVICDGRKGSKFTTKAQNAKQAPEKDVAETDETGDTAEGQDQKDGKNENDKNEADPNSDATVNFWKGGEQGSSKPYSKHYKFLIQKNQKEPVTAGRLLYMLRKQLDEKIDASEALFLFLEDKNILVNGTTPITKLYNEYRNEDGFLYLVFDVESTFG